jgi:hypothetical protein
LKFEKNLKYKKNTVKDDKSLKMYKNPLFQDSSKSLRNCGNELVQSKQGQVTVKLGYNGCNEFTAITKHVQMIT